MKKNGSRLLNVGLLVMLATLLLLGTMSTTRTQARTSTFKDLDCPEITVTKIISNSDTQIETYEHDIPFCQVPNVVSAFKSVAGNGGACSQVAAVATFLLLIIPAASWVRVVARLGAVVAGTNTIICTQDWQKYDELARLIQLQSDTCKLDPSTLGIGYVSRSQDVEDKMHESVAAIIGNLGCYRDGTTGTKGLDKSSDGVGSDVELNFQLYADDPSVSDAGDGGSDPSNIAIDPTPGTGGDDDTL